jgi:hypothetical protein
MKTTWVSKALTGAFALTLILGTASFANAKGPDKGKSGESHQVVVQKDESSQKQKVVGQKSKSEVQKEQPSQKQKVVEQKSKSKVHNAKKDKKITVKSKDGKSVEKRLNSSEATIKSITLSINSFFGVKADGTTNKQLSQKDASSKYNSYKGKLNAELNKLHAIDKLIANYKKKDKSSGTELDALLAKSKELQQSVLDEIKQIQDLVTQATTPTDGTTQPTDPTTTNGTTTTPSTTDPTTQTGTTDPATPVTTPEPAPTQPAI